MSQIVAREQSGGGAGAVVATVGCSVLGFMMAGMIISHFATHAYMTYMFIGLAFGCFLF